MQGHKVWALDGKQRMCFSGLTLVHVTFSYRRDGKHQLDWMSRVGIFFFFFTQVLLQWPSTNLWNESMAIDFCWSWGITEVYIVFYTVGQVSKSCMTLNPYSIVCCFVTMVTWRLLCSEDNICLYFKEYFLLSIIFSLFYNRFHLCYMLPVLSPAPPETFTLDPEAELLLGNSFSVGVTAGLPTPEELELLERCCVGAERAGLMAGGRSWAPASRADRAGLKVVIISEVELLLRRMAASGSRIMMVWSGLPGSELGGFFIGSRVSRTTSGACFTVFWRSSSRSSCSAVLMVFSMSWKNTDRIWYSRLY